MKKIITLSFVFVSGIAFSQVSFPNIASSAGPGKAERVTSFAVSGAGNDRLEMVNGTQVDGKFIPTFWSYRDTDNAYSMVLTASTPGFQDSGTSPLMLFTTNIASAIQFGAPATGDFPWGNSGTTSAIINRPLFQWRNGSNRLMTISPNGNIGIGTETPTAKLHTLGSVRFENLANSTNPSFVLGTDSIGNVFQYNATAFGGGPPDADWLKPDGTVPYSINDDIYTNGKVGINAQTPTANLHSKGTLRLENLPNSTSPAFMLGTDANGNVFEYNVPVSGGGSDADWLKPDGTVPYSINDDIYTNGKVGINAQNPTANLHLKGSVRFENLSNATNPVFLLGTDANGNVFEYDVPASGGGSDADWLKLDGTIPYSINDDIYTNGKVGIDTNVIPSSVGSEDVSAYRLFVKGGILTEEVRVSLSSEWADYVFKKDYNLPTLKEVEKQIEKKGHLKDIPSATEVKADGVELGEMNKLLLQKIEELTLYLIELNKKVEQQETEIEILKKNK